MFTLRIIDRHGYESFYEGDHFLYSPANAPGVDYENLARFDGAGRCCTHYDGKMEIINAGGVVIERYNLTGPLVSDGQ